MSFYLLLSLPALLLVVVWVLSSVLSDVDVRTEVVDEIMAFLPLSNVAGRDQVESLLNDMASGAGSLGVIGVIGLLYAISGSVGAFRFAIETAANVARKRSYATTYHRSFIQGRPLDLAVTCAVIPAILLIAVVAIGSPILESVGSGLPVVGSVNGLVRLVLSLALGLAIFTLMLAMLSPREARLGWLPSFAGAVVAVLALFLVVVGLNVYFDLYTGKSAVYGTIAGVLTVAFSVNIAAIVVIYGVYVATRMNEYMRETARRTVRYPDR